MSLIGPGRGKFTEFVPDHVLGHIDGKELLSVVNVEGMTDHLWKNCGSSRPSLNDLVIIPIIELDHLLIELLVDIRALLN
jgi:hypothetical protein